MAIRRAAKVDDNQAEIVQVLRKHGFSVAITSSAHDGFPDLVVGKHNLNYLLEVKDGNKPPSKQKLTKDQVKFHDSWNGQIGIIRSTQEAIDFCKNVQTQAKRIQAALKS